MTVTIADAAVWLLQTAASQDTVIMRQVTDRGWFETVTSIASGLMSVALLVLTVALVPAAWNFRKSHKRVNELLDRIYGDINPIVRHVSTIADNVDYISTSIRVDIQQVNQTIAAANQRLNHAVALTEQRLNDFSALLRVVQQEAENTFVSTASALRGVRAGADTLREELAAGGEPAGTDAGLEDADLDDADFDDADLGDDTDYADRAHHADLADYGTEELTHGDDHTPGTDRWRPAPRIRPRPRGGGTA